MSIENVNRDGFGARLKEKRKEKGYTQESLAAIVGCSVKTMYRLEHGDRTPHPEILYAIARVLGLSIEYLLYGEGED